MHVASTLNRITGLECNVGHSTLYFFMVATTLNRITGLDCNGVRRASSYHWRGIQFHHARLRHYSSCFYHPSLWHYFQLFPSSNHNSTNCELYNAMVSYQMHHLVILLSCDVAWLRICILQRLLLQLMPPAWHIRVSFWRSTKEASRLVCALLLCQLHCASSQHHRF